MGNNCYDKRLSRIRCEVRDANGNLLEAFTVDQNTHYGRRLTATTARQAMRDGDSFTTFPERSEQEGAK